MSTMCVLPFLSSIPSDWYSKLQNCVETSTYGSEIVAGHIAVDVAVELRYNLRMLGTRVKGTTVLFGDNKIMITNTSLPQSVLKNMYLLMTIIMQERQLPEGLLPPCINQQLSPVMTAGKRKTDLKKQSMGAISGTAKYVNTMLSPFDMEYKCIQESGTVAGYGTLSSIL
eukprot:8204668-Ditylum_brightwellii.AAC.1